MKKSTYVIDNIPFGDAELTKQFFNRTAQKKIDIVQLKAIAYITLFH